MSQAMIVDATGLDDCITPLQELSFDKSPAVREQLYILSRDWMCKLMDRYTFGYKILPLLMAGLTDSLPKLSALTESFMDEIGALYEIEWESRIKDEMDYSDGYDKLPSIFSTNKVDRPRVGCRHLARDNTQKVVQKFIEGLGDWNADVRAKSALNLTAFLRFTEDQVAGYTNNILPISYKILSGDELNVMEATSRLVEIIGFYVSPDTTLSLILPVLSPVSNMVSFKLGSLRSLQALLRGSVVDKFYKHIDEVVQVLSEKELLQNENMHILLELSRCVYELIFKIENDGSNSLFELFLILVNLRGVAGGENIPSYSEMKSIVIFVFLY
jgi:dynein assembly factor 5